MWNPFISLLIYLWGHAMLISSISGVWAPSPGHVHYCTQRRLEKYFNLFTYLQNQRLRGLGPEPETVEGNLEKKVESLSKLNAKVRERGLELEAPRGEVPRGWSRTTGKGGRAAQGLGVKEKQRHPKQTRDHLLWWVVKGKVWISS